MTSETRTLIEPDDITGVEMECDQCHVKTIFPITTQLKLKAHCPHCGKQWFDDAINKQTGSSTFPAIDSLHALAAHLWALSSTRTDIHGRLRLHINTEQKSQP